MKISTQNIKVKINDKWVPVLGINTGETVLYSIQRDSEGNIQLVGTDGSITKVPIAALHIGEHTYNGSSEVNVDIYDGEMKEELMRTISEYANIPSALILESNNNLLTLENNNNLLTLVDNPNTNLQMNDSSNNQTYQMN